MKKYDVYYAGSSLLTIYAENEQDCRRRLRKFYDVKKLPNGTLIEQFKDKSWLTSREQMEHFTIN